MLLEGYIRSESFLSVAKLAIIIQIESDHLYNKKSKVVFWKTVFSFFSYSSLN